MSKSSTTAEKLAAAIAAVQAIPLKHRAPFVNLTALRQVLAERESNFRFHVLNHPTPWVLDIPNCISHAYGLVDNNPVVTEFLRLKQIIAAAEELPEVVEAERLYTPLIAEVRRLEALLAEEELAAGIANREREEAKAAAIAAAIEKAESEFATA
jgi:hypothetical protein